MGLATRAGSTQQIAALPELITTAGWRTGRIRDAYGHDGTVGEGETYLSNRAWINRGHLPGKGTRWQQMAYWGLVDLKQLLQGGGAMAAGAAPKWGYSWS